MSTKWFLLESSHTFIYSGLKQKTAQTTINRSADKQIMAYNEMSLKK